MTRDEIIEFLIENDIDHTRHNIDTIEEIYSVGFEKGYNKGREDGWKSKEKQDKQIEKASFEIAAKGVLGDNWEELAEYYGIKKPE